MPHSLIAIFLAACAFWHAAMIVSSASEIGSGSGANFAITVTIFMFLSEIAGAMLLFSA